MDGSDAMLNTPPDGRIYDRKTFENWSMEPRTVSPHQLAQSGFFYLGNLDRVQCFSCGGVLRNWRADDSVEEEHRAVFPNCKMVLKTEARNVPLSNGTRSEPNDSAANSQTHSSTEHEMINHRSSFPCLNPVNPHMRNVIERSQTFHERQRLTIDEMPRQLANAGFFFLGDRDRVKCWYCNGGLQNWDRDYQPWTEHAKWFPTCEFLLQKKGVSFVRNVVAQFPDLDRPALTNGYNGPFLHIFGPHLTFLPPPAVAVPRAALNAEIEQEMEGEIPKAALEFGFMPDHVKERIKMKLIRGESYESVSELIEDLQLDEKRFLDVEPPPEETDDSLLRMEEIDRTLQTRIQELEDERRCKICLDEDSNIVLIPCGHLCCCATCAGDLATCPICRGAIQERFRAHIA